MPDTRGFAVVVEATPAVLRKALQGAWKSAECPEDPGDEGRIPETIDIEEADAIGFGSYVVRDGQVQIPQDQLDAAMAPDIDGAELKFGLVLQAELKDPPVPSATLFDMTVDVRARVPIRVPAGEEAVYIILDGLPRDNVSAALTSGDPIAARLNQMIRDYVHLLYEADGEAFPHSGSKLNQVWPVPFGSLTVDTYYEVYDDLASPPHAITVVGPAAGSVTISIPIYLRIYNIRRSGSAGLVNLLSPMGIETRIVIQAPFEQPPGLLRARFGESTVTVDAIVAAGAAHGQEGPNYTANKMTVGSLGLDLDTQLQSALRDEGLIMAQKIGLREIPVPTVAEIETAIATFFHTELEPRERIAVWTPVDAPESGFEVDNVTSRAHADFLAIAINAGGGADIGALTNFVPAGREFAIGLSVEQVNKAIAAARDENDLEDGDLPKRLTVDDDEVDINDLDVFLVDGAIRITGEVTVIDAVLGSIDVDADFTSNIGLEWFDGTSGQQIRDVQLGEPDIDPEESVLLWVIGLIIGILTGGLGGAIIAALILLIITLIVNSIASSIGSAVVTDEVSGKVVGFGGWPEQLSRIGRVESRFENPITIEANGITMAGTLEVISSCEATAIAFADSGGSYSSDAAAAVTMSAQRTHADAAYTWSAGDGSAEQAVRDLSHTYLASGFYIAKHALTIQQPGGVRTRHFAAVEVANVAPIAADAGPDITVDEGEVVTLVGRFRDVEYADTHETSWIFGDDQPAAKGRVSETNIPPQAIGTSTVEHAWCDNGTYTVTFTVRDQNGGVTQDTLIATVRNVPPAVDAGPDLFAYRCMPITLIAAFEDNGWCDTHTAWWDFGDCSPPQTAVVRETNLPPAARGTATATHIYECCGRFHARCTVADDDGAATTDAAVVDVVELLNPGFEGGYRTLDVGKVGNHWQPYAFPSRRVLVKYGGTLPSGAAGGGVYDCEECVVHDGQRSQRIAARSGSRAGVQQSLGANPGWTYQVSAWAFVEDGVTAWLGIDPSGNTDPLSPSITWTSATAGDRWNQLCERVVATGNAITVFLESECDERPGSGFHDNVEFVAVQDNCPPSPEDEPCDCDGSDPKEPQVPSSRSCVDFSDQKRGDAGPTLTISGFAFGTMRGGGLSIVPGAAASQLALLVGPVDIIVAFPFAASRVVATVVYSGGKPLQMTCVGADDNPVGQATSGPQQNVVQTLEVTGSDIVRAHFTGQEGRLISICIDRDTKVGRKSDDDRRERRPMTVEPQTKLDSALRAALNRSGDSADALVNVIIAVEAGDGRSATSAAREDAFAADASAVVARLRDLGATDLRLLWISRSVSARLPLQAVTDIAAREDVSTIAMDTKRKAI